MKKKSKKVLKKVLTISFIIIVLLLDIAALDDITTGHEPKYIGEYLTLLGSIFIFGYLFLILRKKA